MIYIQPKSNIINSSRNSISWAIHSKRYRSYNNIYPLEEISPHTVSLQSSEYYQTERNRKMNNTIVSMAVRRAKSYEHMLTNTLFTEAERYAKDILINTFGLSVDIKTYPGSDKYKSVLAFIKNYDKHQERHISITEGLESIVNKKFILKLRDDTYALVKTGRYCIDGDTKDLIMSSRDDYSYRQTDMNIYFFGKKMFTYYKKIYNIINKQETKLQCFKVSATKEDNFRSISSDLICRDINTIFLESHVIEKIEDHLDRFLSNEPIYTKRNLIYKTGILLQGEPGTGKTSLANAIASKYGLDLIIINMSNFGYIDIEDLTTTLNCDDKKYVVLLEDIDCVISDRENGADRDDQKQINKLLQFLDSNSSPTNVIFIATTNHPDKLDDAIKRSGRFDLTVHIGGIKEAKAIEMCKSFQLDSSTINNIMKEVKEEGYDMITTPVNQSYLQTKILESFDQKIDIVQEGINE